MFLFNENKEIPIIKVSGAVRMIHGIFKREKSETIGTCFSDDVVKVLKSVDKKQFKEDSLLTIGDIRLCSDFIFDLESGLVTESWTYHIGYSIYLGGILGGGKISIEKSEFEQSLRDIKLNNLLD
jgi:hypothetical protein